MGRRKERRGKKILFDLILEIEEQNEKDEKKREEGL